MIIIAHRSGPTIYPEQTILSAQNALQQGADMIEIDVRFTHDKQLAVSHDETALRVFGSPGDIANMTSSEFLSLRHKDAPAFPAHLLEHYLQAGIAPLLIHIKEDSTIPYLLTMIQQYHYAERVVLGVQTITALLTMKASSASIKTLAFMPQPNHATAFIEAGADYIRLWEAWLTEENLRLLRQKDAKLWVMVCETEVGVTSRERLKRILSLSPDGIILNDVREIKAVQYRADINT